MNGEWKRINISSGTQFAVLLTDSQETSTQLIEPQEPTGITHIFLKISQAQKVERTKNSLT